MIPQICEGDLRMSSCENQKLWREHVDKQEATISCPDENVQLQIKLIHLTVTDMKLLKWARKDAEPQFNNLTEEMIRMIDALPKLTSLTERISSGLMKKICLEQLHLIFSGSLDAMFLKKCIGSAQLFRKYDLKFSCLVAFFHLSRQVLAGHIRSHVKDRDCCEALTGALDRMISLEQQLVLDELWTIKLQAEKQKEEIMRFRVYHDPLTGLPNGRKSEESLEKVLRVCEKNESSFSLLKINIDEFKITNELFGRTLGDLLLQAVVERLQNVLKNYRTLLFRLDGDEFVVINNENMNRRGIAYIVERLIQTSNRPFIIQGNEVFCSYCIGVAVCPDDGRSSVQMIASVDAALREAKKKGRNSYFFYNEELHRRLLNKIRIENELPGALANDQLELFYQPQIRPEDGLLVGVEGLVRWRHPKNGLMLPEQFIPVAEETGLIGEIGTWVLKKACSRMEAWQSAGGPKIPISVNLSVRQFRDSRLVTFIKNTLDSSGLSPEYLNLEITESMMADDMEHSRNVLGEIRNLGIGISLDDFGTGYSSLSYLRNLPINRLKIDRSFISDIENNKRDQAIVAAIVTMAENLWIEVIAEGIETEEQLATVENCRCRAIQGYYYSRPLSEAEFKRKYLFPS